MKLIAISHVVLLAALAGGITVGSVPAMAGGTTTTVTTRVLPISNMTTTNLGGGVTVGSYTTETNSTVTVSSFSWNTGSTSGSYSQPATTSTGTATIGQ